MDRQGTWQVGSQHRARPTELLAAVILFCLTVPTGAAETARQTAESQSVQSVQKTNLRAILPPFNPRLDAVRAPSGFGVGQIWHVGPHQQYKKPSDVVSLVRDGDVVEIEAARYACDSGLKWSANDLTLIGIGGRPVLDATHCPVVGDKGIWNPRGKGLIIDNIEFAGASGPSQNDAGIRYDGTGYLYITNSYFHDNENGILATPLDGATTDVVIDHSEFAHNGIDGVGQTHNIYISSGGSATTHSFVIRFSYSHDAHIGHEVKTRALTNYILYNRLADGQNGDSSYDIDVPQGGLTYIIGNIIQHGVHAQNYAMVSYSAEGTHNPVQELYVVNNTFVSEVPARAIALNLYDNGLTSAKMVNNLVVGVSPSNLVGVTPAKISVAGNVVASAPNFYDQTNRVYYLTATSPAIHAGTDPGSAHDVPLAPEYEFAFPANGIMRPDSGALDAGAYQYDPGQKIPPPPSISFTTTSPIDYDAQATLTWSAANAIYCTATGDWSGSLDTSGKYTSPKLTSRQTYGISCTGAGGSFSRSLTVAVNQSPLAAALGPYAWRDIAGSALQNVCASSIKNSSGSYVYQDNFGTGPYCEGKGGGATGVYVPQTRTWYLIGGAGGRNYYGNEVYGFNVATLKPELVTLPDHIGETKEYVPTDGYNSKIHLSGCDAILHGTSGGIVPAASAVVGTAAWSPRMKEIIVGPGTFVKGSEQCSVSVKGSMEFGQMTTDIWSFTPPSQIPAVSASVWHLLAPDNNAFGSVTTPLWFLDPATGLIYVAGNRAYGDRGGFLIDPTQRPPRYVLVNADWPYGSDVNGASAIDTDNHYVMVVGSSSIAMWNLNGLSMVKYDPKTPFNHDAGWTVFGSVDFLSNPHRPGLTYNPNLKAFVAWTGSSVVYFLYPNYRSKTINIVAKMDTSNAPTNPASDLDGKFVYLPDENVYLAFTKVADDFHFLVPPTASQTSTSVTNGSTPSREHP